MPLRRGWSGQNLTCGRRRPASRVVSKNEVQAGCVTGLGECALWWVTSDQIVGQTTIRITDYNLGKSGRARHLTFLFGDYGFMANLDWMCSIKNGSVFGMRLASVELGAFGIIGRCRMRQVNGLHRQGNLPLNRFQEERQVFKLFDFAFFTGFPK